MPRDCSASTSLATLAAKDPKRRLRNLKLNWNWNDNGNSFPLSFEFPFLFRFRNRSGPTHQEPRRIALRIGSVEDQLRLFGEHPRSRRVKGFQGRRTESLEADGPNDGLLSVEA